MNFHYVVVMLQMCSDLLYPILPTPKYDFFSAQKTVHFFKYEMQSGCETLEAKIFPDYENHKETPRACNARVDEDPRHYLSTRQEFYFEMLKCCHINIGFEMP